MYGWTGVNHGWGSVVPAVPHAGHHALAGLEVFQDHEEHALLGVLLHDVHQVRGAARCHVLLQVVEVALLEVLRYLAKSKASPQSCGEEIPATSCGWARPDGQ